MDSNPPPTTTVPTSVGEAENPYFASVLPQTRISASTGLPPTGHTTLSLGAHSLAFRPTDGHRLSLVGYGARTSSGEEGVPTALRTRALANGTLTFSIGDNKTAPCRFGSVHILDEVMVFGATAGAIGPSELGDGEHYALVAEPDLIVAVERRVDKAGTTDGFRVVLVNPIGAEPLVVTVGGLDSARLAGLVTGGEAFMHGPVGSAAGWRSLEDGWQTMEWNGAPPVPEARRIQSIPQQPPAEPTRSWRLVALLGVAAVAIIGLIAFAATLGDDDRDDETVASAPPDTAASTPTSAASSTTASTQSTTTTTEPPPSTTTSTAPAPTTEAVASGAQLATWGFLERDLPDTPSGDAACPASTTATTPGTVVGVAEGLNIRDGADGAFDRIQRIALGYDEVRVFPSIITRSARGTEWVQIALPEPPGWRELATWEAVAAGDLEPGEELDPFAYGCGWAATQFLQFDR